MLRFLTGFLVVAAALLSFGHAYSLEPALRDDTDFSWPSVQGSASGNPLVKFNGNLTAGKSTREKFIDVAAWIVSEDFDDDGSYEAAVMFNEGTLRIISPNKGRFRTIASTRKMAPGVPPVVLASLGGESTGGLVGIDDRGDLVSINYETGRTRRLSSGFSSLSHPLVADLDGDGDFEIVAASDEGHITVVNGKSRTRSDDTAELIPDTRITAHDLDADGSLEIVALTEPTDQLSTGRLGDDLEAGGVAIFQWDGRSLRHKDGIELPDDEVFETLLPLITGTGAGDEPALMLSVTVKDKGTQIRSYSYSNGRLREIRKGPLSDVNQWIHILGSAKLGSSEKTQLLTSLTNKNGWGDMVLYRLDLAQTRVIMRSFMDSHLPGSRLLEVALIGDMDSDGESELLAPGKGRSNLVIYSFRHNSIESKEIFSSNRKIETNLCPGDFNGDGISDVMFGLEDGTLVILEGE